MVNLSNLAVLKLHGNMTVGSRVFGKKQHAGGFLIQPVPRLSPAVVGAGNFQHAVVFVLMPLVKGGGIRRFVEEKKIFILVQRQEREMGSLQLFGNQGTIFPAEGGLPPPS